MTERAKNNRVFRLKRLIRRIVILAILAGAAVVFVLAYRSCQTTGARLSLPFGAADRYAYTGDGFLYLDAGGLNFYSIAGESRSYGAEFSAAAAADAELLGTDKLKVVHDAASIRVLDTPFTHSIDGMIKKVVCGGKYVGAYIENSDNSHSLAVFNSAGAECYRADFSENVLLDFGFEGDSTLFMSELVTLGGAISTSITTYDLSHESITGVMSVQGQVAERVFLTPSSVLACCTDSVIRFDRASNEEAFRLQCMGYDYVDFSAADGRLFLLLARQGEKNAPLRVLGVREARSADDTMLELPAAAERTNCVLLRGKAVYASGDSLVILSRTGEKAASLPFDGAIDSVAKLGEAELLLTRAGGAELMTLKNF